MTSGKFYRALGMVILIVMVALSTGCCARLQSPIVFDNYCGGGGFCGSPCSNPCNPCGNSCGGGTGYAQPNYNQSY
ncbi:MAG: hypothetical protein KC940_04405 [Candidatus Omnitrophica bacterium]|nr:hypothetical protein [Candidatus Omnitrophota bacterium]MCA9425428.1 hypothetical protein [Candidatus Omnitrophota bacterium]MCA9429733.1 hypothetical protein [Candidatus Omnitrophota bacterium]MCB9767067.1 hypothetical protein [Candidatus Omnitrophota bacterium]MCB9781558.1 hypothetical protein [Candidatus Omnitrophota bacterium]